MISTFVQHIRANTMQNFQDKIPVISANFTNTQSRPRYIKVSEEITATATILANRLGIHRIHWIGDLAHLEILKRLQIEHSTFEISDSALEFWLPDHLFTKLNFKEFIPLQKNMFRVLDLPINKEVILHFQHPLKRNEYTIDKISLMFNRSKLQTPFSLRTKIIASLRDLADLEYGVLRSCVSSYPNPLRPSALMRFHTYTRLKGFHAPKYYLNFFKSFDLDYQKWISCRDHLVNIFQAYINRYGQDFLIDIQKYTLLKRIRNYFEQVNSLYIKYEQNSHPYYPSENSLSPVTTTTDLEKEPSFPQSMPITQYKNPASLSIFYSLKNSDASNNYLSEIKQKVLSKDDLTAVDRQRVNRKHSASISFIPSRKEGQTMPIKFYESNASFSRESKGVEKYQTPVNNKDTHYYSAAEEYQLALLYLEENAPSNAFIHMEKAAYQGLHRARTELGFFYLNGIGIQKNTLTGKQWLKQAASCDEPKALEYFENNRV